ncbi:unnamed protein product, partial [Prorocentrum cordatum]
GAPPWASAGGGMLRPTSRPRSVARGRRRSEDEDDGQAVGHGRKIYRTRTSGTPDSDKSDLPEVPGVIRAAVDDLWPKHDPDGDGRITWKTGEAMAFLKEFFEAFDHPMPEAGKVMFHQMYSMVLSDANCPAEVGLNKESRPGSSPTGAGSGPSRASAR